MNKNILIIVIVMFFVSFFGIFSYQNSKHRDQPLTNNEAYKTFPTTIRADSQPKQKTCEIKWDFVQPSPEPGIPDDDRFLDPKPCV